MVRAPLAVLFSLVFSVFFAACVDKKVGTSADAAPATVTPAASAPQKLTVESCEAILIEGEEKLSRERRSADKACTKDDDCMLVHSGACAPACIDFAMTKTAAKAYAEKRKEIDHGTCRGWRSNECPTITPKPELACPTLRAKCENKQCVAR